MNLDEYRQFLNEIDEKISQLFEKRMRISGQIGRTKASYGRPVLDASREVQVLERVERNVSPDMRGYVRQLYEAIMSISRQYQRTLTPKSGASPAPGGVVYAGVPGAYAESAALDFFPGSHPTGVANFSAVIQAVEQNHARYGVLPIANSTTGAIFEVLDALRESTVSIIGEISVDVQHCLLAPAGTLLEQVKKVYSHPQGLEQCAAFIQAHHYAQEVCQNTAQAAQMVAQLNSPEAAAIASPRTAALYQLSILSEHIQACSFNRTRFVVIAAQPIVQPTDRISLVCMLRHECGSLNRLLSIFADGGINLLSLHSRPLQDQPWSFCFHIDIAADFQKATVRHTLEQAQGVCQSMRILGAYPAQEEPA